MAAVALVPSDLTDRAGTIRDYRADQSASTRLAVWAWTLDYVGTHPLGGGFEAYRANELRVQTVATTANGSGGTDRETSEVTDVARAYHSAYFEMLGEQGWPGLALWLAIQLGGLFSMERLRRRFRRPAEGEEWIAPFATALQHCQVIYLVGALFVGIALQPFLLMVVAVQIGLAGWVSRRGRRTPRLRGGTGGATRPKSCSSIVPVPTSAEPAEAPELALPGWDNAPPAFARAASGGLRAKLAERGRPLLRQHLDQLVGEGGDVVRVAAGDQVLVHRDRLIHDLAARVLKVRAHAGPAGDGAALHDVGLDQQPGRVADRGDRLARLVERLDQRHHVVVRPQAVGIGHAAGQHQRVVILLVGGGDQQVGRDAVRLLATALSRDVLGRQAGQRAGGARRLQLGLDVEQLGVLEAVGGDRSARSCRTGRSS